MELRRRKRGAGGAGDGGACVSPEDFINGVAASCRRLVVFTGSGLSASSGMSMFSTRNGLYDRARKKFKIQDGIKLFTYSFYKQRRAEVQAFFAQIYSEAQGSQAAPGHHALSDLAALGCIVRHYTLNIDGLAEAVGMSTWHHEANPKGSTVEMHGNIRQLVCPGCHAVEPLTRAHINTMKALQPVECRACMQDSLRFKIMLYDDDQGDCITPEHVFETLEEDLETADCVLWVGISFEQSASVEYFRRVRSLLASLGRLDKVTQAVVNPSDDAYFNIISSMCNVDDLRLLDVRAGADTLLPDLARRMRQHVEGGGDISPDALSRSVTPHLLLGAGVSHRGAGGRSTSLTNLSTAGAARRVRGGLVAVENDYVYDHDSDYEKDHFELGAAQKRANGLKREDDGGGGPRSRQVSPGAVQGVVQGGGFPAWQGQAGVVQGGGQQGQQLMNSIVQELLTWQNHLAASTGNTPIPSSTSAAAAAALSTPASAPLPSAFTTTSTTFLTPQPQQPQLSPLTSSSLLSTPIMLPLQQPQHAQQQQQVLHGLNLGPGTQLGDLLLLQANNNQLQLQPPLQLQLGSTPNHQLQLGTFQLPQQPASLQQQQQAALQQLLAQQLLQQQQQVQQQQQAAQQQQQQVLHVGNGAVQGGQQQQQGGPVTSLLIPRLQPSQPSQAQQASYISLVQFLQQQQQQQPQASQHQQQQPPLLLQHLQQQQQQVHHQGALTLQGAPLSLPFSLQQQPQQPDQSLTQPPTTTATAAAASQPSSNSSAEGQQGVQGVVKAEPVQGSTPDEQQAPSLPTCTSISTSSPGPSQQPPPPITNQQVLLLVPNHATDPTSDPATGSGTQVVAPAQQPGISASHHHHEHQHHQSSIPHASPPPTQALLLPASPMLTGHVLHSTAAATAVASPHVLHHHGAGGGGGFGGSHSNGVSVVVMSQQQQQGVHEASAADQAAQQQQHQPAQLVLQAAEGAEQQAVGGEEQYPQQQQDMAGAGTGCHDTQGEEEVVLAMDGEEQGTQQQQQQETHVQQQQQDMAVAGCNDAHVQQQQGSAPDLPDLPCQGEAAAPAGQQAAQPQHAPGGDDGVDECGMAGVEEAAHQHVQHAAPVSTPGAAAAAAPAGTDSHNTGDRDGQGCMQLEQVHGNSPEEHVQGHTGGACSAAEHLPPSTAATTTAVSTTTTTTTAQAISAAAAAGGGTGCSVGLSASHQPAAPAAAPPVSTTVQ